MQTFSKNFSPMSPWHAIGEFIDGMRFEAEMPSPILDDVGAKNPSAAPTATMAPLFDCKDKIIGDPAVIFPHTASVDTEAAAADPAVARWLDMLARLRPYNVKGQIAGIHRYLTSIEDISALACVARALPWTGPIIRAEGGGASRADNGDGFGDAALVRYISLRHLGVHTDRLRLVWLANDNGTADWIVLCVALSGQWVVLDHYHGDIVGENVYLDTAPYFSLNAEQCRLHWPVDEPDGAEASLARLATRLRFGRA